MNAYELADGLKQFSDLGGKFFAECGNMLRQQADRIAKLEKSHIELEKGIVADLNQRQSAEPYGWHCFEDGDDCLLVNGKNLNKPDNSWQKVIPLYTTPLTKPLSDEEINEIAAGVMVMYGVLSPLEFAWAIEERHGIK